MKPFDNYPGRGRELVERKLPSGTARHDYGPPVAEYCGYKCAYCARDLAESYEAWLDLQVDHVIPRSAIKLGFREGRIDDIANLVICCAACNAFLNRHTVKDRPPDDLQMFFDLRDRVFEEKRRKARKRHDQERQFWTKKLHHDSEGI